MPPEQAVGQLTVREMTREDLDRVCGIIRQHSAWDAKRARDEMRRDFTAIEAGLPRGRHYVAELDGEVVGCSGWHESANSAVGVYWLSWTYVDENRRREGIATALLNHVIDTVKWLGGRKLYIDTGPDGYENAISFYQRHGFRIEANLPDYYQDCGDCIIMARRL